VTLSIKYKCEFGQSVKVVGDSSELGSWDVKAAHGMEWGEGHVWSTTLNLVPGSSYEFKVVIVNSGNPSDVRWEEGANKKLEVPADAGVMEVSCLWSQPALEVMSVAPAAVTAAAPAVTEDADSLAQDAAVTAESAPPAEFGSDADEVTAFADGSEVYAAVGNDEPEGDAVSQPAVIEVQEEPASVTAASTSSDSTNWGAVLATAFATVVVGVGAWAYQQPSYAPILRQSQAQVAQLVSNTVNTATATAASVSKDSAVALSGALSEVRGGLTGLSGNLQQATSQLSVAASAQAASTLSALSDMTGTLGEATSQLTVAASAQAASTLSSLGDMGESLGERVSTLNDTTLTALNDLQVAASSIDVGAMVPSLPALPVMSAPDASTSAQ